MYKKQIKYMMPVLFALVCLIIFNKNVHATTLYQTGNTDTSVTINWAGLDTTTNYRIGYVQIPVGADYSKVSELQDKAKANAEAGQIVVAKDKTSYTITGLKAQSEYCIYLYYTYGSYNTYESYCHISAFTKIKKVNNVAQYKWWKYIEKVDVSWDKIPASSPSDVKYEVVFMNSSGKTIEKKTCTYNSYYHAIKNNKIYKVKVRAIRTPNSDYTKGMSKETTAWSDVQYLFTQPTVTYSKLTNSKLTVKWNKISGVSSYTVYISPKKSSGYKKVKTVKASKRSIAITKYGKKKLSKLKKKKYYVYVVPNKKVAGKIIKKDVTYTYEIKKGTKKISEGYK